MSPDDGEVRRELARVEELIASVQRGGDASGESTPDAADSASQLTATAEDEAVLESLRARRDRLRAQLEQD